MKTYDIEFVKSIETGGMPMFKRNNTTNCKSLTEFTNSHGVLYPVVHSQGKNYASLEKCLYTREAFFVMCNTHGSLDYRRYVDLFTVSLS